MLKVNVIIEDLDGNKIYTGTAPTIDMMIEKLGAWERAKDREKLTPEEEI